MKEEIPMANPPLTPEELSAASKLSDEDLKAIDDAILANSSNRWLKVAMVVARTADALEIRYPDLSYVFYAQRLCQLADKGRLDSQGNLLFMRFSEVRLAACSSGHKSAQK